MMKGRRRSKGRLQRSNKQRVEEKQPKQGRKEIKKGTASKESYEESEKYRVPNKREKEPYGNFSWSWGWQGKG